MPSLFLSSKQKPTKTVFFQMPFHCHCLHTKTRSSHARCWHCVNEGGTTSEFLAAGGSLGEGWDLFLVAGVAGPSACGEEVTDSLGANTVLPDSDPYPLLQLLRFLCTMSETVAGRSEQSSQ